jgi:hypothetical protein
MMVMGAMQPFWARGRIAMSTVSVLLGSLVRRMIPVRCAFVPEPVLKRAVTIEQGMDETR